MDFIVSCKVWFQVLTSEELIIVSDTNSVTSTLASSNPLISVELAAKKEATWSIITLSMS